MTRSARNLLLMACLLATWCRVSSAAPVCALIDTAKLPLTPLLEAKLLATDGATWVERTELDKLLAERELQAAFAANGGAARSSLGAIVKADILVLLRSVKLPGAAQATIECVVTETKGGLRLRTISIGGDQDPQGVVSALEELIQGGLKKHGEKIETVVAVPPFLSEDLSFEHNYLQSAYAKVVEDLLLAQPGVLVVELGEAQAIAKELTLAGEKKVTRLTRPPLYVIGRYRHDGLGEMKTIRMSLRLLQSDTQLTLKGIKDLPPHETPAWIVKKSTELLPLIQGSEMVQAPLFSAEAEGKVLASRGRQFQKIGNWAEAHALFEASLLLRPAQEDVRKDAIIVSGEWLRRIGPFETKEELTGLRIAIASRGYEHLETWLRTAPDLSLPSSRDAQEVTWRFNANARYPLIRTKDTPAEWLEPQAAAARRRTESLLRIARFRADAGKRDVVDWNTWERWAVDSMSDQERYATVVRMADEWRDLPDLSLRLERMVPGGRAAPEDNSELQSLLDRFQRSDRPELREVAAKIRALVEKEKQNLAARNSRPAPPEPVDIDPQLRLLTLRLNNQNHIWEGLAPSRPGTDVLWRNALICSLQSNGELADFYKYPHGNFNIASVVFDGKYVWAAGKHSQHELVLLAVDPSGKGIQFVAKDGIPGSEAHDSELKLLPILPGKVCVVGYTGRSWAAVAEVNEAGQRKFEVIFEAREASTGTDDSQLTNPHIAFRPTQVFILPSSDKKDCRILIGRHATSRIVSNYPVLLDPATRNVQVTKFPCGSWQNFGSRVSTQGPNEVYFYDYKAFEHLHLSRLRYPGDVKETVVKNCPEGYLSVDDRGVHIVGKSWWLADVSQGTVKPVVEKVAWYYGNNMGIRVPLATDPKPPQYDLSNSSELIRVFRSSTHGPLAVVRKGREEKHYHLNLSTAAP